MRHPFLSISLLIMVASATPSLLTACGSSQAESGKERRPAVPVSVITVVQKTLPVQIRSTGVAEAYATVSVKSRIGGQLIEVAFKDGQDVKQGDLLFRIDPRPLEAQLQQAIANQSRNQAQLQQAIANQVRAETTITQAKANRDRDSAQLQFADFQRKSYDRLYQEGAISRTQAEQFRTNASVSQANVNASGSAIDTTIASAESTRADIEAAKANLAAGEAAIENARVQLSYTDIYSPIDGRVSSVKSNQGNLIKADADAPLVTISQIRPIYVTFTIPERSLAQVKQYQKLGKLKVDVLLPNDKRPVQGELTFIDSLVDATTGTVTLKATFNNKDDRLTPGQRVDVVLNLTEQVNALSVPTQAVQTGQKGQFVYVLKSDSTVEIRPVKVSNTVGSEVSISEGLQAGEKVVTDGQFALSPNAKVEVKEAQNQGDEKKDKEDKSKK
ncbi:MULTISPECIES: efflux RND transporter periplasmic adaptor subunit [Pseudanabaena]|uniref:Efflux transporter, RND family, MFP subunit n=2 Tax=Pseudanabaena TaxID=1152 RepID=L8MYW0_9CYAN|nr:MULTISPECIES: efflux RND transporter periplasmic adaptor subunit [Pseudanabaena]ELS33177.1 efflux transporter, RND family, MFP subunit [Pseudanabaena biceps PCC 7429]MDG3494607.1 efflux RND transporter periplasmic adaptor subunit [Pseudanabaena catenata USMAC16]